MFEQLFEKLKQTNLITEKLSTLRETKSWEQIALALYGILDDIDTASDMCKENTEAFQNMVMKLQAKKNAYMYSPDGFKVVRVNEEKERNIEHTREDGNIEIQYPTVDRVKRGMMIRLKDDTGIMIVEVDTANQKVLVWDNIGGTEEFKEWHSINDVKMVWDIGGYEKAIHLIDQFDAEVKDLIGFKAEESKVNENLTDHARKELEFAGLFDKDSDYNGMLGEAVLALIEKFANQGHSGFSAELTTQLFNKLAKFQPLTELTDSPDEWMSVSEHSFNNLPMYQSRRSPACFSQDGGKTYYDLDEMDKEKKDFSNKTMHNSKHIDVKDVI